MPNNLKPDTVIISSTLKGSPYVGIPRILPTILPVNLIEREPGAQPPRVHIIFIAERVEGNIYTLTIDGYRAIELEGGLFGAVELPAQEWIAFADFALVHQIITDRGWAWMDEWTASSREMPPKKSDGSLQPKMTATRSLSNPSYRVGRHHLPTAPRNYIGSNFLRSKREIRESERCNEKHYTVVHWIVSCLKKKLCRMP
ncbi:hypothetical protein EDC04DRAFT_3087897 [Pisolithus marmoratus]|nr:hypothetical protein EDC04DRAFT_3087897 [Pisolithus marmoratus]